ncbi:MinD/ParA family protein [Oceanispirochaeta crateris]|uniref:MinD/ParA family protein n=1 Tax=Oceanispirochaeta crateris TaxID=2518645 RepID=A0A5C1QNP5_9SPIO|nr:P-loop NTPase [Oceanispirochaeta crateris]QEN07802.1 MinD/ParA family protein [Oceanispirochaeta crateris]
MNRIIPVASGKGGVGKSFITVNLGVSLAGMGKTVILVDLDLGASNLHTLLGIKNNSPGIGSYLNKQADNLESLIIPTAIDRLFFLPGDGLYTTAVQQHYFQKMKIIKELPKLVADYILLDLGAGTNHNIVDYFIPFPQGIIVTIPETTAILNAYSFLKSALARSIYRHFPPRSAERDMIQNFFKQRLEGSGNSLFSLADQLSSIDVKHGQTVRKMIETFYPGVIINMGRSVGDRDLGKNLRIISRKNLGISLQYLGYLEWMPEVSRSITRRSPYCLDHKDQLSSALEGICRRIDKIVPEKSIPLYEGDEDLDTLSWTGSAI